MVLMFFVGYLVTWSNVQDIFLNEICCLLNRKYRIALYEIYSTYVMCITLLTIDWLINIDLLNVYYKFL